MTRRVAVSSADFIRNIGHWQSEALRKPISITHHGRERLVLAAPEEFSPAPSEAIDANAVSLLRADQVAVLENLDEGFVSFDNELQIRTANAIAEAFLGRAREEMLGVSPHDFMPQPFASILSDRLHRVQRSRKAEAFEASAFEDRFLSVRVFPLSEGVGVLLRNVTGRHLLERRLEDSEALANAVRAHTAAAAIRLDARARIEGVDSSFCAWFGFSKGDVVGHRFVDLVVAPFRRGVAELIEAVLREPGARETPLTLLGKRGEEVSGVLSLAPVLTDFVPQGVSAVLIRAANPAEQQAA